MKSNWFVVVDAGGNIYEHTFNKTKGGAMTNFAFTELGVQIAIPEDLEKKKKFLTDRGDREVACEIETLEIVKIKIP
jgi:hypothetical protein